MENIDVNEEGGGDLYVNEGGEDVNREGEKESDEDKDVNGEGYVDWDANVEQHREGDEKWRKWEEDGGCSRFKWRNRLRRCRWSW